MADDKDIFANTANSVATKAANALKSKTRVLVENNIGSSSTPFSANGGRAGSFSSPFNDNTIDSSALDNPYNPYRNGEDPYGGYPYGYGGYGYGSSGGNTGPTENQVTMAKLLGPITQFNQDNLLDKGKNADDIYRDAARDANNNKEAQWRNAAWKANSEWHPFQTQLQRVRHALRTRMGNAAYGSSLLDLDQNTAYQQDVDARQILDAYDQNIASIDNEYLQSLSKMINGHNEFAMDLQDKYRQGAIDYILQLANIHPDLATGKYEGTEENNDEGEKWYEAIKLGAAEAAHTTAGVADKITSKTGGEAGDRVKAIKAAGSAENTIENATAGGVVNLPPWLQSGLNYYKDNKWDPINYLVNFRLSRPDAAQANAVKPNKNKVNYNSSANENYWKTMTNDYAGSRL